MKLEEHEVDVLVDMLNSKGWQIYERLNKQQAIEYRSLATQPPGAIPEDMRTWYSALAAGREEAIEGVKHEVIINKPIKDNGIPTEQV